MSWWQRYLMWRAERGAFRYDGLHGFHPKGWPVGYVEYHDTEEFNSKFYGGCRFTCDMALGNAFDYARIFKGTVHLKGTGPRDVK